MSVKSRALRQLINTVMEPVWIGRQPPEIDTIMERAVRLTGRSDWGDPYFRSGLDALTRSLGRLEGLTPIGHVTFNTMIHRAVVNRLRCFDGSMQRSALIPPVIITGLPRSGTTVLHRLLALAPGHHAPPLWELLDPYSDLSPSSRRRRCRFEIAVKNRLLGDLDRKHYTRADTPEECTLLLANSLSSSLFWDVAPVEGYLQWHQAASHRVAYQEYRRQLEILQHRHPGRRLVLKAPAHLGQLDELLAAVPEAMLVQTHRDPTLCFYSHCSLRETLGRLVISVPDREAIAGQVRRVFEQDLARNVAFYRSGGAGVVHVACSDLRRDPRSVVERVAMELGLGWDETVDARARAYLRRRSSKVHRRHRVEVAEWGVDPSRIESLFTDYRRRFSEWIR
jgi:hypothetical protein